MKRDMFRFHFPRVEQVHSMQQVRERLLQFLLLTITFVGGVVYIAASIQVFQEGLSRNIPLYTVLYLILVITTFLKKLGYRLRAGILLALIYSPGLINLFLNGLNADSVLFFLVLVAMTFLLAGIRSGVLILVLNSLSIAVVGTLITLGVVEPHMGPPQTDHLLWIVGGLVFILTGILLILSLHVLFTGLENQLLHTQGLLSELQKAKTELEEKDRRFEFLLQGSTDIILLMDLEGAIQYVSPSLKRVLDYQPGEILGQKVYDYLHPDDLAIALLAMTPGVPAEQIGPFLELRIRHRDGTWRVLEVVGTEIYSDPAVNGTVVNCRDITERKRIEAELRATKEDLEMLVARQKQEIATSSERLAQLVLHSPVVIYGYGYSEPNKPPFISENIIQLTGYEASGFRKDTSLWKSYIHPEDREVYDGFPSELDNKGYAIREYRFLHKDGRYRWFREEARRVLGKSLPSLEFVGFVVDITDQKGTEAAYADLVENSLQGILLIQDGQPVFANHSLCDSLGLSMQEIMKLTPEQGLAYIHPDDYGKSLGVRDALLNMDGGEGTISAQVELRWIRSDGDVRWLDVQESVIDYLGRPAFLFIILDITKRNQAEIDLLESERINRLLLETTQEAILLIDLDGIVLTCNETTARRFGLSIDQVIGQSFHDLVSPDVAKFRQQKFAEVISSRKPISFEDHRDGYWLLNNFYPIFDEQQNIIQFAIFSVDITDRKQAELNLMESEKLNRLLLETTRDVVILFNTDAKILACNANAALAVGYPVEYLKGRSLYELQSPAITSLRLKKFEEVIRTGLSVSIEDQSGGRWYLSSLYPILEGSGKVKQVALFAVDITSRVEMEDELRLQKENLEAEVAARTRELRILSHELIRAQEAERLRVSRELHDEAGQMLVELGMVLDAVFDELPKEQHLIRKRLKAVSDLVSRATRSIRLLARSLRPPALEVAGLNTVLQDLCREYSHFSHLPISYHGLEINLPDVVSISLYRFVQEALTNVVKHARASQVDVRLDVMDGHLSLTVSDNGKGIGQEKTAGLGLLGIQERAALLGGQVDIHSLQKGTRLTLNIPFAENGMLVHRE